MTSATRASLSAIREETERANTVYYAEEKV